MITFMARLRANVRRLTGYTRHETVLDGRLVPMKQPVVVRIVDDGGGCYLLLRFDEHGNGITDTWHATIADAQRQALVEYEIGPGDWEPEID